jgi:hypothetical protein
MILFSQIGMSCPSCRSISAMNAFATFSVIVSLPMRFVVNEKRTSTSR